ncbi:MAG: UMP kinase [Bacteroidales bacterium]|nr:UMP kinase [Bacteroidales bacterium]
MKYQRILLKLSGEALSGTKTHGLDPSRLEMYAHEINELSDKHVQVGIVIGGGNIFRGLQGTRQGIHRIQGDYMGMLATVINGMALQDALESAGVRTAHLTAFPAGPVSEIMSGNKAINHMEEGRVVIISGGTGNPFFTTDTAAALRAAETGAQVLMKGTRVNGIFDKDPEKYPDARKFNHIDFNEAIRLKLGIMDLTAFTFCMENRIPILVFDMNQPGNLLRAVTGESVGTLVSPETA